DRRGLWVRDGVPIQFAPPTAGGLSPWTEMDRHPRAGDARGFGPRGTYPGRFMKSIPFWKMSGSGNDFVLVDNRRPIIRGGYSAWARRLCHRKFGVGADGLLLLEPDKKEDFRMAYNTADGSRADMCGDGARCMAYFAHAKGAVPTAFRFRTD